MIVFALFSGNLFAQNTVPYRIRMVDSTYTAQLRGVAGTRTAGLTITGTWDGTNFHSHEFDVTVDGRYNLYYDPAGGSNYIKDSQWSGDYGKFIATGSFIEAVDSDGDDKIETQGIENQAVTTAIIADSNVTMPKLSQTVIDFIGSGGNIVNNPDDVWLASNGSSQITAKDTIKNAVASINGDPDSSGLAGTNLRTHLSSMNIVASADYSSLAVAIDSLGSSAKRLLVANACTLSENKTIPATATFEVADGGYITIASGDTLTINAKTTINPHQLNVFRGDGIVKFGESAVKEVSVNWFQSSRDSLQNGMNLAYESLPVNGGNIYIPSGNYNAYDYSGDAVDNYVFFKTGSKINLSIYGDPGYKTRITIPDSSNLRFFDINTDRLEDSCNVTIQDLYIDVNGNTQSYNGISGGSATLITLPDVKNCLVERVWIKDAVRQAILISDGDKATVQDCFFEGFFIDTTATGENVGNVIINDSRNAFVLNNTIKCFNDSTNWQEVAQPIGIQVSKINRYSEVIGNNIDYSHTTTEIKGWGIWVECGNDVRDDGKSIITANTVKGCKTWGITASNSEASPTMTEANNVIISDNIMDSCGVGVYSNSEGLTIHDNQIFNCAGGIVVIPLTYENCRYYQIHDNIIVLDSLYYDTSDLSSMYGIYLGINSSTYFIADFNIHHNQITGCGKEGEFGILIYRNCMNGNVDYNIIRNIGGGGLLLGASSGALNHANNITASFNQIINCNVWGHGDYREYGLSMSDYGENLRLLYNTLADTSGNMYGIFVDNYCTNIDVVGNDLSDMSANRGITVAVTATNVSTYRNYIESAEYDGTDTLSTSGKTVATAAAKISSTILVQRLKTLGGTAGALFVDTITNGTSFLIKSTSATDSCTFTWEIIQ